MQSFKDSKGKSWDLEITATAVKRVASRIPGLYLPALANNKCLPLADFFDDVVKFTECLWVLCEEQARLRTVTEDAFGDAIAGDALEAAQGAFVAAWTDFFPSPPKRRALKSFISKMIEAGRLAQETLADRMEALDPKSLANSLTESSTAAPANSESTPAPSG